MSRPVKVHFSQKNGKYFNFINRDLHIIVLHGFLAQGIALNTFSNLLLQRLQINNNNNNIDNSNKSKYENALSIYNLDARNHGLSPHTTVHRLPDLVADLTAFLKEKHYTYNHNHNGDIKSTLPPAVLAVGHSMGSGTWTQFLMEKQDYLHPLLFSSQQDNNIKNENNNNNNDKMDMVGFVALDMPPIPASQMSETLHTDLGKIIHKMQKMKLENVHDMKSTEAECIRCGICDKRMIGLCTTNLTFHKGGNNNNNNKLTCTWKCNLPVLEKSLAERSLFLPESYILDPNNNNNTHNINTQINVPVLSILGGKSPIGGEKRYQNMFPPFVKKECLLQEVIIPNATHTVYFDKPNETVDAVMHFLETLHVI